MRSAPRGVLLAAPAGVVVAAAWLRLEHPLGPLWRPAVLVALALAAAAVPRRRLRVLAAVVASLAAARLALGVVLLPLHPLDPGTGFGLDGAFGTFAHRFGAGLADYYGTHLPFEPHLHVEMGEIALAGVFCFTLLVALLAAARQRVAAVLALVAGAGWPATLLGAAGGIEVGAAILAAGLLLLARPGSRRLALALPAAGVVLLAAVAVGSATAARHGLVRWQAWDPIHGSEVEVGAAFVWRSQYGGIRWPANPTVVLRVRSAKEPRYLRAGVLDDFTRDAWSFGPPRSADSLEPAAALRPANQTPELVTVAALAEPQLVGGSIPIRYSAGSTPLVELEPGFAVLPDGLFRGFQYTAWSYIPQPTAADLARSPPQYPAALLEQGMLGVGDGAGVPPFGTPNRERLVSEKIRSTPPLEPYLPLFKQAEKVAGEATTPYAAVARLQDWFLGGRFRYADHPRVVGPPLVGFVTTTHAGYCQFFAGAMALMLRYVGIPARVAVGFWGGTRDGNSDTWVVTDTDAHAWVEVWFRGYGWLPFDPTPAAPSSARAASTGGGPATSGRPGGVGPTGGAGSAASGTIGQGASGGRPVRGRLEPSVSTSHGETGTVLLIVVLVLAAAVAGIVLTKRAIRSVRRLDGDPRRIGACCRLELTEFLVDQRVETRAGATVQELGELVRSQFGVDAHRFVQAAAAARFGRSERAAAAAVEARRELQEVLDSIRRGLSRQERLAGLLSIRSLVGRARPVDALASLGNTGS